MISRKNYYKQKLLTNLEGSEGIILIYQHANYPKEYWISFKNFVKDFISDYIKKNHRDFDIETNYSIKINTLLSRVANPLSAKIDSTKLNQPTIPNLGAFIQGPTMLVFIRTAFFEKSTLAIVEDKNKGSQLLKTSANRRFANLSEELDQLPLLHFLGAYAQWEQKKKGNLRYLGLVHPTLVGGFIVRNLTSNKGFDPFKQSGQSSPNLKTSQTRCLSYNEINKLVCLYETHLLTIRQNPVLIQLRELDFICSFPSRELDSICSLLTTPVLLDH